MRLLIIGAGGHGKVVANIAACMGYKNIAFLDDISKEKLCMGYPIVDKAIFSEKYATTDTQFFVAIGDPKARKQIQKKLTKGNLSIATLIHPQAVIGKSVVVGEGTVIMPGAVINPDSRIGVGCIINTGATVDHDNYLEDYVHISVGSHLAGTVHVGEETWIGAGAVVSNNINICGHCMIGAGAVVVRDISRSGTYIGVPAHLK